MAIDPSISLDVRPPQFNVQIPQPLQQFGQVLTLQGLMQEQGLRAVQQQQAELQLQQQRLAIQRLQNVGDYFNSLYNKTPSVAPAPAQSVTSVQPAASAIAPLQQAAPDLTYPSFAPVAGAPPATTSAVTPAAAVPISSLAALATAPAPVPAPAPAPVMTQPPLTIPLAGASSGGFPNVDFGKLYQLDPTGATAKMVMDQEKDFYETQGKRLDNTSKTAAQVGQILAPILKSDNPELAKNTAVTQLWGAHLIDDATARDWTKRPVDLATVQQFVRAASDVKTQTDIDKTNLENLNTAKAGAAKDMLGVYDQPGYDKAYSAWPAELQRRWGKTYSPQIKAGIIAGGIEPKDLPKFEQEQRANVAQELGAAMARGGVDEFKRVLNSGKYSPDIVSGFSGATTTEEVMNRGLDPEKWLTAQRDNRRLAVEALKLGIDRQKADAEYGPNSIASMAEQVYLNPDSADKVVPTASRAAVSDFFRKKYGMPYPNPLNESALAQERSSRSVMEASKRIRQALQNPEIAKQVGAVMGNLGNLEQATGLAVGLSPEAARQAQQLRKDMLFLRANEPGSLRARLGKGTMDALESSDPRVNMDINMLQGALDGVEQDTRITMDGLERQRFGGQKMRPDDVRGLGPVPLAPNVKDALIKAGVGRHQGSDGTWYNVDTSGNVTPIPEPAEARQK